MIVLAQLLSTARAEHCHDEHEAPYDIAFFFADEIDAGEPAGGWTGFIETTRFFSVNSQLEVRNIGRSDFPSARRFFASDRSDPYPGSEFLDRRRSKFIRLNISDQF